MIADEEKAFEVSSNAARRQWPCPPANAFTICYRSQVAGSPMLCDYPD
jgi:hypothetical protein